MKKSIRGFTLIELLVVISIIALLSSIVLASLNSARQKSRIALRIATLREMKIALENYYSDNGSYPTTHYGIGPNPPWRTQCNVNLSYVQPNLPSNQVVLDLDTGQTLVPKYISTFSADPSMNAPAALNCYYYTSNGADYKLLDASFNDMTIAQVNQNPTFKDPARNDLSGISPCTAFSDPEPSLAVYSPGAQCW